MKNVCINRTMESHMKMKKNVEANLHILFFIVTPTAYFDNQFGMVVGEKLPSIYRICGMKVEQSDMVMVLSNSDKRI